MDYDVLIVGAGSAGLTAALTLGRCRRRVLVADGGRPRNADSPGVHGFLSRDGIRPQELLRLGREQLAPYETVQVRGLRIEALDRHGRRGFRARGVGTADDQPAEITARRVLLATGVEDVLPPVPGMRELWGKSVLHCPYCHGYEVRGLPLAVYGRGKTAVGLALLVSRWSRDVVVVSDGNGHFSDYARQRLRRHGIGLREDQVRRLVGTARGALRCVQFEDGSELERGALFLHAEQAQRSPLAAALGARLTGKGAVWVDKNFQTTVPGLYAGGDMTPGQQQALVAAADGNRAAICINEGLTREECA